MKFNFNNMSQKDINRLLVPVLSAVVLISIICTIAFKPVSLTPDIEGKDPAQIAGHTDTDPESQNEAESDPEAPVTASLDLIAVGDNLCHMSIINGGLQEDGSYNYDSYFELIKADVQAADIAVVNQETMLAGDIYPYAGYPLFNTPQEMGDTLVRTGFNVVLHATNHVLDVWDTGVESAMNFWKTKHPETTVLGINDSAEAQETINIVEKNGIKAAVLNYTYGTNGLPIPEDKPYLVNMLDEEMMERHIARAKELADVISVFPHWGTEYVYEADEEQLRYTEFFAKQGVDIVIGSHPHVVQPMEWVERPDGGQMLVYYSLGNLISGQDEAPRMLGGMARLTIEKTGDEIKVTNAGVTPLVTHYDVNYSNQRVYKLSDYTEELAQEHGMITKGFDDRFTREYIDDLAKEVFGNNIIQ